MKCTLKSAFEPRATRTAAIAARWELAARLTGVTGVTRMAAEA